MRRAPPLAFVVLGAPFASCALGAFAVLGACGGGSRAASPDAGDAASAGDGESATDGADEADTADAGARWCDTKTPAPAFCDDFDRGDLGATWDFFQQTPPGVGALDTANYVSSPAAFGIVTKKIVDVDYGTILLRKTLPGTFSRARLAFDVDSDAVQSTGTLAIATLDLAVDHLLTLYLRDDDPNTPGPTLTEQPPGSATPIRHSLPSVPAPGTFTHVEIDADTGAGTITVSFGGVAVLAQAPVAKGPIDQPTIRVGILVSGPAAPYTMAFDDVTLELSP